jgi:hypothetical protein
MIDFFTRRLSSSCSFSSFVLDPVSVLPAAWSDALLSELQNFPQDALDGAEIQVGESLEADATLAATHLAQLCEVSLHDVALTDVEGHVILLRGQGANVAECRQPVLHGLNRFGRDTVDESPQLAQGRTAVGWKFLQVFTDGGGFGLHACRVGVASNVSFFDFLLSRVFIQEFTHDISFFSSVRMGNEPVNQFVLSKDVRIAFLVT